MLVRKSKMVIKGFKQCMAKINSFIDGKKKKTEDNFLLIQLLEPSYSRMDTNLMKL